MVREKFFASTAAPAAIVRFAVKLVELLTFVEFTVMPLPTFTTVTPLIKFAPVKTTSNVCKRAPLAGEMLVTVGAGFSTVKIWFAELPPPGPLLVMEKFRGPIAAAAVIVRFAVKLVPPLAGSTVLELTLMPLPAFTEVTPLIKFVPVKTTSSVCKRLPITGVISVNVGTGLPAIVKPFGKIAVAPPGGALVTETFRAPSAALESSVIVAVICVGLLTTVEFTVMPGPKLTELTPSIKFVPINNASSVCRRLPLSGEILVTAGAGLFTVKVRLPETPPPGLPLLKKKLVAPVAAAAVIVRFAVKFAESFTVVELTVMPGPTLTLVTPLIKFVPLKTTSSVCKRLPLFGVGLIKVGRGLLTVKIRLLEVGPPSPTLVTEKFRGPVAAAAVMVRFAVKLVALLTVIAFTVMPAPAFTAETPSIKFVPVKTTSSLCKRFPKLGAILVKVGTGLLLLPTVKV